MKVSTVPRPYHLSFQQGGTYPISSDEAQRLIDNYPAKSATKYCVILRADDGRNCSITPATLGGGPAFEIVR
jgi:hypothetical protein